MCGTHKGKPRFVQWDVLTRSTTIFPASCSSRWWQNSDRCGAMCSRPSKRCVRALTVEAACSCRVAGSARSRQSVSRSAAVLDLSASGCSMIVSAARWKRSTNASSGARWLHSATRSSSRAWRGEQGGQKVGLAEAAGGAGATSVHHANLVQAERNVLAVSIPRPSARCRLLRLLLGASLEPRCRQRRTGLLALGLLHQPAQEVHGRHQQGAQIGQLVIRGGGGGEGGALAQLRRFLNRSRQ